MLPSSRRKRAILRDRRRRRAPRRIVLPRYPLDDDGPAFLGRLTGWDLFMAQSGYGILHGHLPHGVYMFPKT